MVCTVHVYVRSYNRRVILLQVSEEQRAISYGCTIDPTTESYCANTFLLPINIPIRDRFGSVTAPALVNLNAMNGLI